jgi:hypothetical protein
MIAAGDILGVAEGLYNVLEELRPVWTQSERDVAPHDKPCGFGRLAQLEPISPERELKNNKKSHIGRSLRITQGSQETIIDTKS